MLLVPGAFAQTITYEDQLHLLAPTDTGETGLFVGITGDTLQRADWSFSIYYDNFDYLLAPAPELAPPSRRSYRDMDVDENRITATVGYGLTDRWEVTAALPYKMIKNNAGDQAGYLNGYPQIGKFDVNGMGNLHLATKVQLLDPATHSSRVALSMFVDPETGDAGEGITNGNTNYGVGLHWNSGIWSLGGQYAIIGDRSASDMPAGFDTSDVSLPNEWRLNGGVNVPLGWWATTNWISEVNAILFDGGDRQPDDIVYVLTGLRHWFGTSGWGLSAAVRANTT
ncbi:MAG: hypothetical protein WBX15_11140, partial [Thermoanaerobaculia bacterium]